MKLVLEKNSSACLVFLDPEWFLHEVSFMADDVLRLLAI